MLKTIDQNNIMIIIDHYYWPKQHYGNNFITESKLN